MRPEPPLTITPDVVSFFAHGLRELGAGQIQLADGFMSPMMAPGGTFQGCERVELWACDSGVNLPHDPLNVMVDEAFGLDIEFHRAGARSTIGTLWAVNDYATACIARAYRRKLRDGLPADEALVAAQRWWLKEALPAFEKAASENTLDDAIALVTGKLGSVLGAELCASALGPASSEATPSEVGEVVATLSSPRAWAGFRFVGVCERRPLEPWLDEYQRPPTPEERAEAAALLKQGPATGRTIDDWINGWIAALREAVGDGRPGPRQAIEMARLLAVRRVDKGCNNLVRALAWVEEARTNAMGGDAVRLSTEAAWLYLSLARGELVEERLRPVVRCSPHVLSRVRSAADLANPNERVLVLAWADHLDGDTPNLDEAFSALERMTPDSFERVRAAAEVGALCLAYPDGPDVLERLTRERLSGRREPDPHWLWGQRLEHAVAILAHAKGEGCAFPDWSTLDHTRIARQLLVQMSPRGPDAHEAAPLVRHALNNGIGLLEGDLWGYPDEGPTDGWTTTGTPGWAWRAVLAPYLAGKLMHPDEETAAHFIASLHMGADLRIGPKNLFARIMGRAMPQGTPWSLTQHRERLVLALLDSVGVPGPSAFETGISELVARGQREPLGMTGWAFASLVSSGPMIEANTAAFQAERQVHLIESVVRDALDRLSQEADDEKQRLKDWLTPANRLAEMQDWVHALPTHTVLLGVALGADGRLLLSSVYRHPNGQQARHHVGEVGVGFQVVSTLAALLHPASDDDQQPNPTRDALLHELRKWLASPLAAVLGHVPNSPPSRLVVLAPGPLRGLPWLALFAGDAPLWSLFSTVSSLPHIGFERAAAFNALGGPVVSVAGAPPPGSVDFGRCAIATVRHNHPPAVVAEPELPCGTELPEVAAIESHASELGTLRLYAAPVVLAINGSTEGIGLAHDRVFAVQNHADTPLPQAELVEIWCAVGRGGEAAAVQSMDGDVMPRMVHCMLTSGALGVLDLAWPVHDLVKALVFEFHAHLRVQSGLAGGMELRQAVAYVDHILRQLHKRRDRIQTVKGVLRALDRARSMYLADWGGEVPPSGRFELLHGQVSGSSADLIAEITRPSHLAAFRYWGA